MSQRLSFSLLCILLGLIMFKSTLNYLKSYVSFPCLMLRGVCQIRVSVFQCASLIMPDTTSLVVQCTFPVLTRARVCYFSVCGWREFRGEMGYSQVLSEQEEREAEQEQQQLARDDASDSIIFEN